MVVKKFWNKFGGEARTAIFQKKSIEKFEKLVASKKVPAPKHPTDQKYFDLALQDEKLAAEIQRKNEDLIEKVNKINVTSTEPSEQKSQRLLPTRELESQNRDVPDHNFGFNEIHPEKMEQNTILLREMYELLSIQGNAEMEGKEVDFKLHEGYRRLSAERRENLFKYFGLFVHKEKQTVVERHDLQLLSNFMNNRTEEIDLSRMTIQAKRRTIEFIRKDRNKYIDFERKAEHNQRIIEMEKQREKEYKRLSERLKELE